MAIKSELLLQPSETSSIQNVSRGGVRDHEPNQDVVRYAAKYARSQVLIMQLVKWCGREDLNLHYLAVTSS